MGTEYASTIIFIIFWDFLMFYQFLCSLQVRRCAIISYKHGIYELPHEFPNNLKLRILGNQKISGKCLNPKNDSLVPSLAAKIETLLILAKKNLEKQKLNFFRNVLFHVKTRVYLKYLWMIVAMQIFCLYMERGEFLWRPWNILGIYWWVMKYFSKFLMGHKMLFYVLFSKFYFLSQRGWSTKYPN